MPSSRLLVATDQGTNIVPNDVVDLPETQTFTYDETLGRYTRFTSPDLGAYNDNGEWVFNAEYDWLNAALPLTTQTQR